MIDKPIDAITEADIEDLVTYKRPESRTLDFKECLPGDTPNTVGGRKAIRDEQMMDFARDVAAFANTEGGDLVFGVSEVKPDDKSKPGYATGSPGIVSQSVEGVIRDMEGYLIAKLRPKVQGIRPQIVTFEAHPDRPVLVIRVPRSFDGPHMMPDNSFPGRLNTRNEVLDVGQIRAAFARSEFFFERLKALRDARVDEIAANKTPVRVFNRARFVLQIISLTAFDRSRKADLSGMDVRWTAPQFRPSSRTFGYSGRYNFMGYMLATKSPEEPSAYDSYLQLYHDGRIEAVDAYWMTCEEEHTVRATPFEKVVVARLIRYMGAFRKIGMDAPAYVALSFLSAKGTRYLTSMDSPGSTGPSIDHDPILLPEALWQGDEGVPDEVLAPRLLRPAFDSLWNTAGHERDILYLDSGEWSEDGRMPFDFATRQLN